MPSPTDFRSLRNFMKNVLQKYRHAWVFLYAFIYLPWFYYLEKNVTTDFHIIHTTLDEKIPFIEYFIIPYMLWFAFIAVTIIYFFLNDTKGFYRLIAFLFTGMTLFLIISTVYPNGQILRPDTFARDNIFVDMVKQLYKTDTPTNIFPSIHVYNTIGACIAIRHSQALRKIKWVQYGSPILGILIILSTMFLKQHSVLDVISACFLSVIVYFFAYTTEFKKETASDKADDFGSSLFHFAEK